MTHAWVVAIQGDVVYEVTCSDRPRWHDPVTAPYGAVHLLTLYDGLPPTVDRNTTETRGGSRPVFFTFLSRVCVADGEKVDW